MVYTYSESRLEPYLVPVTPKIPPTEKAKPMVTVTPEDRERATEVIERIDAAPAEPGSEPVVTSNTEVAHGIIATGIAEAREDATPTEPGDCSEVETQLEGCRDDYRVISEELEQAKNAIEGMSLKVRVFNHVAVGLTAMLNIHAQEANAQAEAQKAAEAMAQAQGDVVENSQGDKPTRK